MACFTVVVLQAVLAIVAACCAAGAITGALGFVQALSVLYFICYTDYQQHNQLLMSVQPGWWAVVLAVELAVAKVARRASCMPLPEWPRHHSCHCFMIWGARL